MNIDIIRADLNDPEHASHILFLTNEYAKSEMGGGKPLPQQVQEDLVSGMKEMSTAVVFLALRDGKPVGIANCFVGYSTFYAKKLINVHDLGVIESERGQGIGGMLLHKVTEYAKEQEFCKVTLEVLHNNPARRLYEREGFEYGDPPYFFMNKYLM